MNSRGEHCQTNSYFIESIFQLSSKDEVFKQHIKEANASDLRMLNYLFFKIICYRRSKNRMDIYKLFVCSLAFSSATKLKI